MNPVLYLDFDGILHPADVRVTPEEPRRPKVYVHGNPTDEPLFRYVSLLELLLSPYPDLRIVLATSWVRAFGYESALKRLSPALQERVIGAATFPAPTRFGAIDIDSKERGLTRWIALDDDHLGWPDEHRHQLVGPTNPVLALVEPGVAAKLATMLDALCHGSPLESITHVARSTSTVDRLFALPNGAESEVLRALEDDARLEEILRKSRARPAKKIQ